MFKLRCFIFFSSAVLFWTARGEELSTSNVGELLVGFENYINASLVLDKSDRELVNTWKVNFQVKQVNITSHYRIDMSRHMEHNFKGKKTNTMWKDCLSLHQKQIENAKAFYFDSESECLMTASTADREKLQNVRQVEKEIRKWRKSYKYLANVCNTDYPDDQDAANLCLVLYVKRDNYDVVFQRLLILKLEAMDNLLARMNSALSDLEQCLKTILAEFLNTVRNIMATLNNCYSIINRQYAMKP